jgi:hypothetical protein
LSKFQLVKDLYGVCFVVGKICTLEDVIQITYFAKAIYLSRIVIIDRCFLTIFFPHLIISAKKHKTMSGLELPAGIFL